MHYIDFIGTIENLFLLYQGYYSDIQLFPCIYARAESYWIFQIWILLAIKKFNNKMCVHWFHPLKILDDDKLLPESTILD